jgi:CRP-like cAMP-binding protein
MLAAYRPVVEAVMTRSHAHSRKAEMLAGLPLFEGCGARDLAVIGALFDEVAVEAGTVLVREGTPGLECFFVVEGRATVTLRGDVLGDVRAGDVVGELALLDASPRAATVVAETPMTLLTLDPRSFSELISSHPTVLRRLLVATALRLRQAQGSAAA